MKRNLLAITAAAALLSTAACGRQPWTVVKQATPDPFVGKSQFTVEPLNFEHAQIGDKPNEQAFLADKEQKEKDDWDAAKKTVNASFTSGMAQSGSGLQLGDGAPFVVRPIVTFADPGKYAVVYARSTQVTMSLQILDASNQQVLDEIGISSAVGASLYDPTANHRMGEAAEELGKLAGMYMKRRITPEK
jgi:hypothetical protein